MTNINEKVTLKDVLNAVIASDFSEELKERAKKELEAIDRKNAKAKERRLAKATEVKADDVELMNKAYELLKDVPEGMALQAIAEALNVGKQKIQTKFDDRFVRFEVKTSTKNTEGKTKTRKAVWYKVA